MVLPVPGGPQKISEPSERRLEHAGERAVGAEQMILADDVGELVGAQLVGERPRRVALEAGGRETGLVVLVLGRELIRKTSRRSAGRRA